MEDVEVLDLTTTASASSLVTDETSQEGNGFTESADSTQETTSESSFGAEDFKMKKGVSFPMHLYEGMEPEIVDQLPPEIDGIAWYRIKCTEKDYSSKTSDRRWLVMRTSSRVGLVGRRKIGSCQGSFICENPKCSFLSTEGRKNDKVFNYLFKKKVCRSCVPLWRSSLSSSTG